MKSALVVDCDINPETLPEYLRPSLKWKQDGGRMTPYLPVGTIFDGPEVISLEHPGSEKEVISQAAFLVRTGQAAPGDDECAKAAGLSDEEIIRKQRLYRSAIAGIRGKEDLELFMADVILGYDKKMDYIPGPNWESYQAALKKEDEDEI